MNIFSPFVLIMTVAAIVCLFITAYVWSHPRKNSETFPLILLMAGIIEWITATLLGMLDQNLLHKMLWAKIEYIGVVSVPLLLLMYVLIHTGSSQKLTGMRLAGLALIPAATLLLAWTNDYHGLIWARYIPYLQDGLAFSEKTYGPGFWVYWGYSYLLLLAATIVTIRSMLVSARLFRWQNGMVGIGILAPWVANLLYILHINFIQNLDLTPLAFGITGILLAFGMFRWRLFDIKPLAQAAVIAGMADGLMILDDQGRIIEANPAAQTILGLGAQELVGQVMDVVVAGRLPVEERSGWARKKGMEIKLPSGDEIKIFEVADLPFYEKKDSPGGRIVFLHDITGRKRLEERLRELERKQTEKEMLLKNTQLSMLNQLSQVLNKLGPVPEILERVSDLVGQVLDSRNMYIALYDEATNIVSFPIYWMAGERRDSLEGRSFSNGLTEYVIQARGPVLIPEHVQEALAERGVSLIGTICQCYLGVPIMIEDRVIGVIALQDYEHAQVYDASHVELLSTIAAQAAIAIQNANLFEQARQEIAERKQVEEALQASQRHYQTLAEISPVGIFHTDAQGNTTYVNPRWCEISGLPAEETLEYGWLSAVHPEDREPLVAGWADAVREQRISNAEYRFLRPDGTTRWVMGQAAPETSLDGKIVGYVGTVTDITGRKQAEEALREQAEILDLAQDAILVRNLDNEIVFWNRGAEQTYGWTKAEASGKVAHVLLQTTFPVSRAAVDQALVSEGIWEGELLHTRRDGTRIVIFSRQGLKRDHVGLPSGILEINRDITDRKQAEKALFESEQQLRLVTDHMHDLVIRTDLQGLILYASPSHESVLGLKPENMLGTSMYALMHPEDVERVRTYALDSLEKGMPGTQEFRYRHVDGYYLWLESTGVIFFDEHGLPTGVVLSSHDITGRKQAEDEILQLNASLEQRIEERTRELRQAQEQLVRKERLAVLGELAGSVGHELRNPLGIINGAIYYLKMVQPDVDEKIRQYHEMIEQQTLNAEKIITDLLDFARVSATNRQVVAVPELVQSVLSRFPSPPSVKVVLKLPAGLPMILADPKQMEQVLGNLVINACQAMPDGGRMTISARPKKGMLSILVKDTGTGITPENMQKVFEPLFTTKATGIGLGLAVSKKLVEANGGKIDVMSEAGKGTSFTILLPVGS